MLYTYLLIFHSYYRWLVLLSLALQVIWLGYHYRQKTLFTKQHSQLLILFTILYNIQLIVGWLLFLNSPIVAHFWSDLAIHIKHRQMRFFGMEHVTMMSLAIVLVNISTYVSLKRIGRSGTFTYLFKYYICIFLIVLSSIPWSFSPLTSRPNFR